VANTAGIAPTPNAAVKTPATANPVKGRIELDNSSGNIKADPEVKQVQSKPQHGEQRANRFGNLERYDSSEEEDGHTHDLSEPDDAHGGPHPEKDTDENIDDPQVDEDFDETQPPTRLSSHFWGVFAQHLDLSESLGQRPLPKTVSLHMLERTVQLQSKQVNTEQASTGRTT
jgi:hypothetical protein